MPAPVDRERLQELAGVGAQIVEVLPREEYDDMHLPDAINIPLKELNRQTAMQPHPSRPRPDSPQSTASARAFDAATDLAASSTNTASPHEPNLRTPHAAWEAVGQVDRLRAMRAALAAFAGLAVAGRAVYRLIARGQLTLDTGIGRRVRPLGPVDFTIRAPREIVFDVISTPYLDGTPRALRDELDVWERGSDMVLAAHFTEVKCGTTTTVETVRFERPERVDFRVVRGPIPHVIESFLLSEQPSGTRLR